MQLAFLGHAMRSHGLENMVVTGRIEGGRVRGRQRLKYLDSACASWKDNVSHGPIDSLLMDIGVHGPTQLIRASEDRVLRHRMVAMARHHNNTRFIGRPHRKVTLFHGTSQCIGYIRVQEDVLDTR